LLKSAKIAKNCLSLLLLLPLASCLLKPEDRQAFASLREASFFHARSLTLAQVRQDRQELPFSSVVASLGILFVKAREQTGLCIFA
jgi:hypothetical protein